MKKSMFTIIRETPEAVYAFNSFTGALAKVDDTFFTVMDYIESGKDETKLSEEDSALLKNMQNAGFVVDDSLDEIERIAQIRQKRRDSTDNLGFTIAPTLNCNFGCNYCFQTVNPEKMSDTVQDALIDFIEKKINQTKPKNIGVTWFGGEPLLVKDIVVSVSNKISALAKNYAIVSNFTIITNGYLIDDTVAEQLHDCGIKTAQITLDGCREEHNRRRFLKNAPEKNTYDKILQGINALVKRDIRVNIRMNIDKQNQNNVDEFVKEIKKAIPDMTNINIYLGHVFDSSTGEMRYDNNCLSTEDFAKSKLDTLYLFKKLGFYDNIKNEYPRCRVNDCGATTVSSFVVRYDGNIYRCWNDLSYDDLSVGSIFEGIDRHSERYTKWTTNGDVLHNSVCTTCAVLPLCMGDCPRERVYNDRKNNCSVIKYNINSLIDFFALDGKLFK